jgi:hypothetical protein
MALDGYQAALTYRRNVAPALLTGVTTLSDSVTANGTVPLSRERYIGVQGTVGFAANRQIALDNSVAPFKTFVADIGVGWFNPRYPNVALRFTHLEQFDVDAGRSANINIANFSSNQLMATVGWTLPSRTRLPAVGPNPARSDGNDEPPED